MFEETDFENYLEEYISREGSPILEGTVNTITENYFAEVEVLYDSDNWTDYINKTGNHPKTIARSGIKKYFVARQMLVLPVIKNVGSYFSLRNRAVTYDFEVVLPFNINDFIMDDYTV